MAKISTLGWRRTARLDVVSTTDGQPISSNAKVSHPYHWAPFILIGNAL
ncbi:MAG: hypothetical protein AAGD25_38715 [Cyanobacteria bacterium P01_F01_bin.150]